MALNTSKCDCLTPLHFKGLIGSMDVDPWVDRRTFPPTFWSGGDALCFVPLFFRR